MTAAKLSPLLGSEFDRFLFASVGDERNGMALSVLSALARLNVDPWEVTVALSRMPKEKAKERLSQMIAPMTDGLVASLSSEVVAARLIGLLPNPSNASFDMPSPVKIAGAAIAWPPKNLIALVLFAIVLVSCVLAFALSTVDNGPWPFAHDKRIELDTLIGRSDSGLAALRPRPSS